MTTIDHYLPFVTSFMQGTGLFSNSTLLRKIISITIFLPATVILNILIAVNFANTQGDVLLTAEAIESLLTYSQLTIRKFIFFVHGPLMEDIIADCKANEWHYDLLGPELEAELKERMKLVTKITKMFSTTSFGTIFLLGITAFLDPSKPVPLMVWIPNFKWAQGVIFFSEMVILMETVYYVVASDSFYLLISANLQVQFRLMGETIKSIRYGIDDDAKCSEILKKCVEHHRWVLRLHYKLNTIFSEYFIMQYAITVTALAIEMYLVLYSSQSTIDIKLKSIFYSISVMFQVALYFLPASNIEIEAENFAQDLYLSSWERTNDKSHTKHLLFMMLESQKPLTTLGVGMLHVTRPVILGVVRLGFTIATILGGLK